MCGETELAVFRADGITLYALETPKSSEAQNVGSPQLLGPVIGDISAHVCPCLGAAVVPAVCFQ